MPKQIVFALMTFMHNLFTVVWVGGLITLGVTVMPSAKKVLGMGPQTKQLMDTIQKRLSVLVYVSIVGLVLSGLLMSNRSPAFQGLFSFANTYSAALSIKHILVLAMIAIALTRSLVLGRRSGAPQQGGQDQAKRQQQEKLKAVLLIVNIVLGVIVLLLSGVCTAFSTTPPA